MVETKNDKREIFGWIMYDWANSAYFTTVIGVLLGPYLTALAQSKVGENGIVLDLGILGAITAKSLPTIAVSVSVAAQFFVLPVLGAISDYSRLKKFLMMAFCYAGVALGCLIFFVTDDRYLFGASLLITSNLCIGASIVFYNAYLNDIATEDKRDKVSSDGFAYGYFGGGLVLLINLLTIQFAERLGMSQGLAVRVSMLFATIWWGLFSIVTFRLLKSRGVAREIPKGENYLTIAFKELAQTFRQLWRLKHTLHFLIAYLLYNDGIQTVINVSSIFIAQELFVAKGIETDNAFLLEVFLLAQVMAAIGSFAFERVSRIVGTKYAILISLVIWAAIVIFAYGFLRETYQAWIMGAAIGLVLGGSQALSRSLYSLMIPEGRESAFFSLYEISERGTSWLGPLVFGIVVATTNSYRQAILALIFFFVVGSILLFTVNTKKAILEAKSAS